MSDSNLVTPDGRPLRRAGASDTRCPQCRAPKSERTPSSGFGTPDILCGRCGHNFGPEGAHE